MAKSKLYIDVDDTIICENAPGPMFELRSGVVCQIHILSKLFDCYWLTHWNSRDLRILWTSLYAINALKGVQYLDWQVINSSDKAPAVLRGGLDFYWLEDPLSTGDLTELSEKDVLDRYIPVDPKGMWGFTRAIRVLFDKAGISEKDIKSVGGNPTWFNEPLGDHFDWSFL